MKTPDKRYLLFHLLECVDCGGSFEKSASFDTINEAVQHALNDDYNHHYVYDRIKGIDVDIVKYGYPKDPDDEMFEL